MNKKIEEFDFENSTISDLLMLCGEVQTKEEAQRVIERYKTVNEHAEKNLGYIFGYLGQKERERLYNLFPVNHPVFGSAFGRGYNPTPEECFEKGKQSVVDEVNGGKKK